MSAFRSRRNLGRKNINYTRQNPGTAWGPLNYLRDDITTEDLAWYAGFIDGEGCIGIYKNGGNARGYHAMLTVSNTNALPIQSIKKFYKPEAALCINENKSTRKPQHRNTYQIRIPQRLLLETLSALIPYLQNKQEQAWIAMNFLITRHANEVDLENKIFRDYAADIKEAKWRAA